MPAHILYICTIHKYRCTYGHIHVHSHKMPISVVVDPEYTCVHHTCKFYIQTVVGVCVYIHM